MWNYKQSLKHKTTIVVNRILREKITSGLQFSSTHKFGNINFKNLVLWHALKPKTPGYNQGKGGKTSHKQTPPITSCPQDSLSLIQKQSVGLDFLLPWKINSHYNLHINNYAILINRRVYEKRKKENKFPCCLASGTLSNKGWGLVAFQYTEFETCTEFDFPNLNAF